MKPSIQEQIEHYTNQVAIYISYEYTDEPTLKFMIERLNKLVDQIIKKKEGHKMKNILIDTILYNPMIYVYNITENFVTVYNDIDKKVLILKIKLNKTNDKYITINKNTYYLKYMFNLN